MSLRFRNRLKILPGIYLNLGKNGISTTIGPRGANINIGKKGVYLNTGIPGTGISNREKLFGENTRKSDLNSNLPSDTDSFQPIDKDNNANSTQEIITSEGLEGLKENLEEAKKERALLASEEKEISDKLAKLQSDLSKKQNGFFSLFTKKETVDNLQKEVDETSQYFGKLKKQYEESKADINIHFDSEVEERYKRLAFSFAELINSKTIWDITTETVNTVLKSSARSIVERKEVKFKLDEIDFIKSEYAAFHLQNSNGSDLFIYPGFVLLMDNKGEITLVDLKDLKFNFSSQRFQESKETIPPDSKIIDYTWYKVNKDGSRDMRYAANFQIPIVKYGVFTFASANGLNETYYISNFEISENFSNEFRRYLDLLNHNTGNDTNISQEFSKQYYDLLFDFSFKVSEIRKKLESDENINDKFKDVLKDGISIVEFVQFCILYDFYQILNFISKGAINPMSLESFGLLLLSGKIMQKLSAASLGMDYETLPKVFSSGVQKDAVQSIIKLVDVTNPVKINVHDTNADQIISSKKVQGIFALPTALKMIDHPLFDEYAITLYRFANIIAKADNTVSKEEEKLLKEIYQLIHNPIPDQENKSLNISEVNEKESLNEVLNELETLIGLDDVKQEVISLINYIKIQKEREKIGLKSSQVSYHCVFTGSPGTGKTTIARIVAKIYMHLGILKKGHLVETDRSGLVAEYLGQTAVKVNKTVDSALDGVLFIDEAYSLVGENKDDFGKEAVATLIKRMEDDRDKLILILAGYTQEMKTFIDTNPGFKSRFNRYIEFKDYSPDELEAIYKLQCSKLDYILTDDADKKLREIVATAFATRDKFFGNGRFARNIFEKTLERQANRIASVPSLTKEILTTITVEDIPE
jgi:SpoVK/Ycf46/Vps4 family AAA+-type ATPase